MRDLYMNEDVMIFVGLLCMFDLYSYKEKANVFFHLSSWVFVHRVGHAVGTFEPRYWRPDQRVTLWMFHLNRHQIRHIFQMVHQELSNEVYVQEWYSGKEYLSPWYELYESSPGTTEWLCQPLPPPAGCGPFPAPHPGESAPGSHAAYVWWERRAVTEPQTDRKQQWFNDSIQRITSPRLWCYFAVFQQGPIIFTPQVSCICDSYSPMRALLILLYYLWLLPWTPLVSVERQPQCPLFGPRGVEWTKRCIFLEIKHHLLKFKATEVGWQACGYLRRSWDAGWPSFCAIRSFSSWCGVSRGTDRATVYV